MTVRTIHLGVGGRGAWPLRLMPERDDFTPVALVDVRPDKLADARKLTGLGEEVCFSAFELDVTTWAISLPGHWLSARKGLLHASPLFFFALVGAVDLARRRDRRGLVLLQEPRRVWLLLRYAGELDLQVEEIILYKREVSL